MLPIVHRKAYVILALLLVCVTTTMAIECQVYTAASAHAHVTSTGPHHSHGASGYTAGAMPCLLAVLPSGVSLIVFSYVWFHITLRMLHRTSPVFPLFIPPRNAARASRTLLCRPVLCVAAIR